jgi:hypothetical protein
MLLHAAQNVTSRLVSDLVGVTDAAQFINQYYLISVISFGLLMLVVAVLTRGQLGYQPGEEGAY